MAWVETRITRTSQPQDACGVDWSNPLATQLTSAWWGDSNFIGPAGANKLGAYRASGKVGVGRFFTAGAVTILPANSFGHTESESRLAVIKVPSGTNRNISSTSVIGAIQLRTNGNDLAYVEKQIAVKISAAGVLSVGETCVVGVSRDANAAKLYKSGRLLGTSAGRVLAASALPAIGQDGTGSALFESDIYLHLAWSRVLSDAEFKSLSENPWQIFEPEIVRIWVDDYVSAGGGATVIPIGVQATGSVGTPSATGAANATPAGVSTTASVGTPTATGGSSIAATALPAGVAASSAVGAPAATGAAVAQPVGVVASSAVGTPVAIGESAGVTVVYPAGVQAVSAVGTPSVTAAARVIPIGVQAVGEVGGPLAYAGDEPPVVASSNYGFEMSAGKRYYIKRKGKILLFDSAEQADDYLAVEQQATVVTSRGAKKRIAAKLVKVAPIETIELEPVTELLSRYMPEVSLPNLLKMRDIEQVIAMQQQALMMQDDEDIELLLMTL